METWEEDGIIYTVYPEDEINVMARQYTAIVDRLTLQRYAYIAQQTEQKNKYKYLFLTINPNPHITLKEFIVATTKMMSKPWIAKYLYCYEQRGETEEECGKGFHFHAIIEKPDGKSYAHILRELSSSANKLCDTSCMNFFNIKNISEEEKNRKITYITGQKADALKHAKQQMDIPFRQRNNLLSFYNIGILDI